MRLRQRAMWRGLVNSYLKWQEEISDRSQEA